MSREHIAAIFLTHDAESSHRKTRSSLDKTNGQPIGVWAEFDTQFWNNTEPGTVYVPFYDYERTEEHKMYVTRVTLALKKNVQGKSVGYQLLGIRVDTGNVENDTETFTESNAFNFQEKLPYENITNEPQKVSFNDNGRYAIQKTYPSDKKTTLVQSMGNVEQAYTLVTKMHMLARQRKPKRVRHNMFDTPEINRLPIDLYIKKNVSLDWTRTIKALTTTAEAAMKTSK